MYKKPYVEANTYSGTYLYPTSDPVLWEHESRRHSADPHSVIYQQSNAKNKFCKRTIPIANADLWKRLYQASQTVPPEKRTVLTKQIFHSPEGKLHQPNN